MKSISVLTILTCCVSVSTAANILALFVTASPSHHIWNTPLAISLANRGHNVTVLSPEEEKNSVPNLTYLVMKNVYEDIAESYIYEDMADTSTVQWVREVFLFMGEQCKLAIKTDAFKQLINYPTEIKFDLIIIEAIGTECLHGIFPTFGNPPIVSVNGFSVPHWALELTGTPNIPSHMPNILLAHSDHMTFTERIENFLINVYSYYYYHCIYLPEMDRVAAQHFGSQVLPAHKTLQNVSIVMANFHPTLDYPWAMAPSLIPIAGVQIGEQKPLPTDVQNFLDDATEGAIFFSLGSNVRSDKLTLEKRRAIIDAFAELPQKVLWKFESDLPDLPKNVKVGKWLPQSDILAHPNMKVFITHSGLLSTHEAAHRGVPVIGIPFLADQHTNIRRFVKRGCGILLEYKHLTKETLQEAVHKILSDPSYRENMKTLSARFQDNPQTPLESAVFWTEYVLRHKGAPHLRSAAKDLNIVQYFLIDVIVFLLAIPVLVIGIVYCLCCTKKSKSAKKKKQN